MILIKYDVKLKAKGDIIITLIIILWFVFSQPQQQVAGVVDIKADPNHPVETFFGSPNYVDLSSMVKNLDTTIYPEDKISTIPDPKLGIGSKIMVTRATPVEITDAKVAKVYRTWKTNIADLLIEKNIQLLGQDSASPDVNSAISYNMKIKITRVAEVEVKEKEVIDYKIIKKNSADLEKGQTSIETKGVKGEKEITYKVKRVDGVEVSKEKIDSQILKEAVSEVQIIGIGPKLAKSGPYLEQINGAAKEYLINGTALMCLMMLESGGTADTGDPDGPYYGLFQYEQGYWASASAQAGYGGSSIYNPTAQIYTTAYQLTHGQSRRWPPWGRCSGK